MPIRPDMIMVTSNFRIETMLKGSVYAAIYRRFDKIYMFDQGEKSVPPSNQFLSVLCSINYVLQMEISTENQLGPSDHLTVSSHRFATYFSPTIQANEASQL